MAAILNRAHFGRTRQHIGDVRRQPTVCRAFTALELGGVWNYTLQPAVAARIFNCFETVASFSVFGVKNPNVSLVLWPPVQRQKTSAVNYNLVSNITVVFYSALTLNYNKTWKSSLCFRCIFLFFYFFLFIFAPKFLLEISIS